MTTTRGAVLVLEQGGGVLPGGLYHMFLAKYFVSFSRKKVAKFRNFAKCFERNNACEMQYFEPISRKIACNTCTKSQIQYPKDVEAKYFATYLAKYFRKKAISWLAVSCF